MKTSADTFRAMLLAAVRVMRSPWLTGGYHGEKAIRMLADLGEHRLVVEAELNCDKRKGFPADGIQRAALPVDAVLAYGDLSPIVHPPAGMGYARRAWLVVSPEAMGLPGARLVESADILTQQWTPSASLARCPAGLPQS